MRAKCNRRRLSPAGFTYIELMVVLLICGILTAAATPIYMDNVLRFRVDAAAKRLAADISFAQHQAQVRSTTQNIVITPNAGVGTPNSYSMPQAKYINSTVTGAVVNLTQEPYRVIISSATFGAGTTLTFDRYGAPSSGGTVVLQSGSYQKTITVNASTGKVTIT